MRASTPVIVLYLEAPPTRERVIELINRAGLSVREALRQKGTPYDELGLGDSAISESSLLDAIERYPILLNRPFVVSPKGVRLCRPSEVVLEILPPIPTAYAKEDGEVVRPM